MTRSLPLCKRVFEFVNGKFEIRKERPPRARHEPSRFLFAVDFGILILEGLRATDTETEIFSINPAEMGEYSSFYAAPKVCEQLYSFGS